MVKFLPLLPILFLVTSLIIVSRSCKRAIGERDVTLNFFLKKKYFYISLATFIGCFVLASVSYFVSDVFKEYIHVKRNALDVILIYGGSVLLGCVTNYLAYEGSVYFINNAQNKKDLIKTLLAFVLFVVLFIVKMQGVAPYLKYPLCNRIYFGSSGVKLITANTGYDWKPAPSDDSWGFAIAFYALCILSGAALSLIITNYILYLRYKERDIMTTIFCIVVPCGIIGARLWYVVGNFERDGFNVNPGRIFNLSEGGLTIIGGAVFGIAAGLLFLFITKYLKKKEPYKSLNIMYVFDVALATILLAQAVGRWGNFFNNEVHGNLVDISKYKFLPDFILNNMRFSSAHSVHNETAAALLMEGNKIYAPLFIVEASFNFCGFAFILFVIDIWFKNSKNKVLNLISKDGVGGGLYFIWYGIVRFFLEPLRDQSFNMGNDDKFSVKGSLGIMAIGIAIIIAVYVVDFILKKKAKSNAK